MQWLRIENRFFWVPSQEDLKSTVSLVFRGSCTASIFCILVDAQAILLTLKNDS